MDIARDVNAVQADLQSVQGALASSTSTAVKTDLTTLQTALTKVVTDLSTGASSAATDLGALASAQTQLATDLGTAISPTLNRQLRALRRDVTDLSGDVARVGQALGSELREVQMDAQALAAALGTGTSATVTADLTALNNDLAKVAADFTAGTPATADLNTLVAAENTLAKDLGNRLSSTVRRDLNELREDTRDLSRFLTQTTAAVNRTVADIQRDMHVLSVMLASNTNATVTTDLSAFGTALAAVSADLSGNVSATTLAADVSAAMTARAKLSTDLGSNVTAGVLHRLNDVSADLMELAILLAAMKT